MRKYYSKRYIVNVYFQFVQHFLEIYAVYHEKSLNFLTLDYREEDIERFNSNPGIVLSAHLGNWELCGYWLSSRIQQKKFGILVGQSQSSFWHNVLCDNRKRWNIVPFFISDRFKSMYSFISEIRGKKMVTGFFLDADYTEKTAMISFLGKEQNYLSLPFHLSSKYKVPVYTAFFLRRGLFSFEFILSQGIQVSNYHDTIIRDIYREIEEQILAHPHQWVWPLREVQ